MSLIIKQLRKRKMILMFVGVGLAAFLGGIFFTLRIVPDTSPATTILNFPGDGAPEFIELKHMQGGFDVYAPYFKKLAEEKGGVYAFQVLLRAPLPPNLDLHLLGHVVGDELYKQQGITGIKYCTNDFRNACSHSIVVGTLLEHGEGSLPEIAATCKQAPGGRGAYTMCFHGLGHGILAYFNYELPPTIQFCEKVGTKEYNEREYVECVGGAIMELIGGGGHDKEAWARVTPKYFKKDDPLYPCDASFMPTAVRAQCYQYLTPHLFKVAGADMGHPLPKDFSIAFRYCGVIPNTNPSDKADRDTCFGGFGKEFVVLAQDRDIRRISDMTEAQLATVVSWCALAEDKDGTLACDGQALQSLFWGGENAPDASLRFCGVMPRGGRSDACYAGLTEAASFYVSDPTYRSRLCEAYPPSRRSRCKEKLLPAAYQSETSVNK